MTKKDKRGGYRNGLRQFTIRVPDVLFRAVSTRSKVTGIPAARIAKDIILNDPSMKEWLVLAQEEAGKDEGGELG